MLAGEISKLMPVPRRVVLGNANPRESQAVGFQHHLLWGETAVAASFGGMDVEVDDGGHEQSYSIVPSWKRQLMELCIGFLNMLIRTQC
jgi:hypothetical protein